MDARKQNRGSRHFLLAILILLVAGKCCVAQNVYKDYVRDKCTQYSPFDYQKRGFIYKLQTGHAGLFGECDDDRQKMVSPYIDWHCRKADRSLALNFVNEMFGDIFRKSQRLADGAGACVLGNCRECQECQPVGDIYQSKATNSRSTMGMAKREMAQAQRRPSQYSNLRRDSSQSQQIDRYAMEASRYTRNVKAPAANEPTKSYSPSSNSIAFSARGSVSNLYGPSFDSYSNRTKGSASPSIHSSIDRNSERSNGSSLAVFEEENRRTTIQSSRSSARRGQTDSNTSASYLQNYSSSSDKPMLTAQKLTGESRIDPRFQASSGLVPENRFAAVENQFQSKQIRERKPQANRNSTFKLSSGSSVYNRPVVEKSNDRRPLINSRKPAPSQKSDPQYFQFQQIGGSKYR